MTKLDISEPPRPIPLNNTGSLRVRTYIMGFLVTICVIVIAISMIYCKSPSEEVKESRKGISGVYTTAAVVSNGGPCSEIGKRILEKYNSTADAAIAVMFCDGVTTMQYMGIGGGFFLIYYDAENRNVSVLNARETAPAGSTFDMFHENSSLSQYGGRAVAIPGELMGYWELKEKFGKKEAPWEELVMETVKLCEEGVPVSQSLARSIKRYSIPIQNSPSLWQMLSQGSGSLPVEGDKIKLPKLAQSLRVIAKEGAKALYNGSLTDDFISDIQEAGGIITREDMESYRVRWEKPYEAHLKDGFSLYSIGSPGSGEILGFIFKIIDGLLTGDELKDTALITEAFKYGFARRANLGDPHFDQSTMEVMLRMEADLEGIRERLRNFNQTSEDVTYYGAEKLYKEDHGTDNIVVIGPNGDAVVATSTVNLVFGSKLVSEKTGIILNNEMDDFSAPGIVNYFGVPPSSSNFIAPGKIPMSSMCPAIFLDDRQNLRLAIGGAGGTHITTSVAVVSINNLWKGKDLRDVNNRPRFHHQLLPMQWFHDPETPQSLIRGMQRFGHKTKEGEWTDSCVTAISVNEGVLTATSDFRRQGNTSGW